MSDLSHIERRKLVFGMNQSLDGYVDPMAFAPSPTLFRHFIQEAQVQARSVCGRQMYEVIPISPDPAAAPPDDS